MEVEKTMRIGVIIPEQLLKDVKHLAIEKNTSISDIVRKNLEKEVNAAKGDNEEAKTEVV
jgi:metal-responsive CopG/Arc/MetJ family transcriptional regulator